MDLTQDPLCIIGASCRVPGGIQHPSEFWKALCRGEWQLSSTIPPDSRGFTFLGNTDHSPRISGRGGWLGEEGIEKFDALFFNISEDEAITLRPNIRLALELTYEALQNSGISAMSLRGTNVSVSIGVGTEDGWDMKRWRDEGPDAFNQHWAASSDPSGIAGHVSHFFDFKGPCNTVSNACASGAFALRDGINSLLIDGAEVAVVGAIATHFSLAPFQWAAAAGVASGQCRSAAFSAEADGYSPSEGAVFFILKRYGAACAMGDPIYGVVRSLACGHNGKMRSLVTPNTAAQAELTRMVLKAARLQAEDVKLLEAHGTGTPVGDALETEAIRAIFGHRSEDNPLLLSSSKTVFGHCHGAAALVGILKVLCCFDNLVVPSHQVKPKAEFSEGVILIPTAPTSLPSERLFAQVNSFGFTGSISSIILEKPSIIPTAPSCIPYPSPRPCHRLLTPEAHFLPFSAASVTGLDAQILTVFKWALETQCSLPTVAAILGISRDHHRYRRVLIITNIDELKKFCHSEAPSVQTSTSSFGPYHVDQRISVDLLNLANIRQEIFDGKFGDNELRILIENHQIIEAARILYERGHTLDFRAIYSKGNIDPIFLKSFPFYQFERKRCWKLASYGHEVLNPNVSQATVVEHCPNKDFAPSQRMDNKAKPTNSQKKLFEEFVDIFGSPFFCSMPVKSLQYSGASHILLTGGNGMLGTQLLSRLLIDSKFVIYCIVRGDPLDRMRTAFLKYRLPISILDSAYERGTLRLLSTTNLCSSKLGLSDEDYFILQKEVDTILHAAWPVNFNLPLAEFKPFFSCTRNLVELATTSMHKIHYHFVGSYASTFNYRCDLVPERVLPPRVEDSLAQGYAISKLIAENILIELHKCHPAAFELTIMRIGQICGDTLTGTWNQHEMMPMMIASLPALRSLPREFPNVSWIPSDICADAVRDILLSPPESLTQQPRIMHIANPNILPWRKVAEEIGCMVGIGMPELLPFDEYVQRVQQQTRDFGQHLSLPVSRLLPYFIKSLEEGSMPKKYASLEVIETLKHSQSLQSCPPIASSLLGLMVKKLLQPSTKTPITQSGVFLFGPWSATSVHSEDDSFKAIETRIFTIAQKLCLKLGNIVKLEDVSLSQQLKTLSQQLAIVQSLKQDGIIPSAVLGYCFGEYAAAITAGILEEETAIEILVRRVSVLKGSVGEMLNVFSDVFSIRRILSRLSSPPSIAIYVGPTHSVLSGLKCQIRAADLELRRKGVKTIVVNTSVPFHSSCMDNPMRQFSGLFYAAQNSDVKYVSGLTASIIPSSSLGLKYWLRHMREPVNFYGAVQYIRDNFKGESLIDIGPSNSLEKTILRYGWDDITVVSHTDMLNSINHACTPATKEVQNSLSYSQAMLTPAPTPPCLPVQPSIIYPTDPDSIALGLLRDLFGYDPLPELLKRSLHSVGLSSMDFIRFADHFSSRTGLNITLSAFVSDASLEAIIRNARHDTS